jgi:hypothetical protein
MSIREKRQARKTLAIDTLVNVSEHSADAFLETSAIDTPTKDVHPSGDAAPEILSNDILSRHIDTVLTRRDICEDRVKGIQRAD